MGHVNCRCSQSLGVWGLLYFSLVFLLVLPAFSIPFFRGLLLLLLLLSVASTVQIFVQTAGRNRLLLVRLAA